jgi:hypothetical protein
LKKPYDHLPFMPIIVAESVAGEPLRGFQELEEKRGRMTLAEVQEFVERCDARLRASYDDGGAMADIARLPAEQGRDKLKHWIRDRLVQYLRDPERSRGKADPSHQPGAGERISIPPWQFNCEKPLQHLGLDPARNCVEIVQGTGHVIGYWVPIDWDGDCPDARMAIAAPELFAELSSLVGRAERDDLHTAKGWNLAAARAALAKAAPSIA